MTKSSICTRSRVLSSGRRSNSDRIVEILRQMAEIVIWGEQNDEVFFMYF